MLTARGDLVARVVGLETGADDYLAKPSLLRELAARICAMLRRRQILLYGAPSVPERLRFGGFTLDLRHYALRRGDEPVDLNSAELLLLEALAMTPNRAVSRHILLVHARGRGYEANVRRIDVQILRLRQAIETVPAGPHHIKTVWGSATCSSPRSLHECALAGHAAVAEHYAARRHCYWSARSLREHVLRMHTGAADEGSEGLGGRSGRDDAKPVGDPAAC